MTINYAKSSCMHVGPRCDINCANSVSFSGESIFGVREMQYLGIFLTRSRVLSCSILLNALFIAVLMQYLVKWEDLRQT